MNDENEALKYKGKEYKIIFNLNVLEAIQAEYETFNKWINLITGKDTGEPDAKAIIFAFTQMINEGIDIDNDDRETPEKPLTIKQVGRMITEIGIEAATNKLTETIDKSTQSGEDSKNE